MGWKEVRPGVFEPDEEDMKFLKEKQIKKASKAKVSKKKSTRRYSYSPKHSGGGRSFIYGDSMEFSLRTEQEVDIHGKERIVQEAHR